MAKREKRELATEYTEAAEVAYLAYVADHEEYLIFGELADDEQARWRRVAIAMVANRDAPTYGGKPTVDPITGDRLT